jgi:5-methylcytosine-specific restriction enzyme subunit McrC
MLTRLDLAEGSRSGSVFIPRPVAAGLTALNVATLVPTFEQDCYDISNVRKVGVVIIDKTIVRIQPKTQIRRLFALLAFARSPDRLWREDSVTFDADDDLYSTIADAFARATTTAVSSGLLRGYVAIDDAVPFVRGRWRITDQLIRRAGQTLPLEVTYDDYIEDIPENRLLRTAIQRLLRFPDLAPSVRKSLRGLLRLFDEVTTLRMTAPVHAIPLTRQNTRYHSALILAELILAGTSLEHREGTFVGSGFLIDLWTVFEDFIGTALGSALEAHGGQAITQYTSTLDTASGVSIEPDLVWKSEQSVTAVVDIKYKVQHNGNYPNADLYQLVAYCTRFGLDAGHLIYAGGADQGAQIDVINGPAIFQHALNLSAPFPNVLDQVQILAAAIASGGESVSIH